VNQQHIRIESGHFHHGQQRQHHLPGEIIVTSRRPPSCRAWKGSDTRYSPLPPGMGRPNTLRPGLARQPVHSRSRLKSHVLGTQGKWRL
jgi:hypothetical protein